MKSVMAFLWLAGSSLVGLLGLMLAGSTAWLRKSKAQEAAKALNVEIDHAKASEEFRAKVTAAVAEKAKSDAEKEKQNDTVDNANSLIASLLAGTDEPSGG